jgi:hypothetical protein
VAEDEHRVPLFGFPIRATAPELKSVIADLGLRTGSATPRSYLE